MILAYLKQAREYLEKGYTLPAGIQMTKSQQMFTAGKTMCFGPAWYYNSA